MVQGKHAAICDACVALAQSPFANVAFCASCTVVNGKHHPACPENEVA